MSSQKTTNYDLNQWLPDDAVLRTDFNADNAKIDAALQALADTAAGHTAALAGCGNCQIQLVTYQGNGSESRTFYFDAAPRFIFVTCYNCWLSLISGAQYGYGYFSTSGAWIRPSLTWSGNSVTLSTTPAEFLGNASGVTYSMVVLMERETAEA